MSGYAHAVKFYNSLSNTDKAYIQRSDDKKAIKIRALLKDIKKHRSEALADELLPLLHEVKVLGEQA